MTRHQNKVILEVNPVGCKCGPGCELPCFQRIGWCESCQQCGCEPFATEPEEVEGDG